jgi:hypothetical protein
MKKFYYLLIIAAGLMSSGCSRNDLFEYDTEPPLEPINVVAWSGDNRVDISWDENTERDVAGYNVYYSTSYNGKYTLIGSTKDNYYVDYKAVNGDTYYYAVTAYDYDNNESELSRDVVYSTPRPEGLNKVIADYINYPDISGYDFSAYSVVNYKDGDFFFENSQGELYLNVFDDSRIADMGATKDIYDITEAPSLENSAALSVKAIAGHTYIIRTWDLHYAKVRIYSLSNVKCTFDWAYQLNKGVRTLKTNTIRSRNTKELVKEFLNRKNK